MITIINDVHIVIILSYLLWERVTGGQVQGSLCDAADNPVLLFGVHVGTELTTMPLNLTNVRYSQSRMHTHVCTCTHIHTHRDNFKGEPGGAQPPC